MRIKSKFDGFVFDDSDRTLDSNQDLEFADLIDTEQVLSSTQSLQR
jgi:hypothetical protein